MTATAAAASARAKCGPAPPCFTCLRNATEGVDRGDDPFDRPPAGADALNDRHDGAGGRHDHRHQLFDQDLHEDPRDHRLDALPRQLPIANEKPPSFQDIPDGEAEAEDLLQLRVGPAPGWLS